ncbi:MAG: BLUF domain-containing protein [Janthinobacterium lividum]
MKDFSNEEDRRRAIAWAIAVTQGTPLAPQAYEANLLERYARGELTLDQAIAGLDGRVHHVLYRSRAVRPFSDGQLTDLLEQSRAWNEPRDLTGLLVYSRDGHFVQIIEGDALEVHALFARILRDPRHEQVTLLSEAAGPARRFPDWRMAFAVAEPAEFHWLVGYLAARQQHLVQPHVPVTDAHLNTLLHAFGNV